MAPHEALDDMHPGPQRDPQINWQRIANLQDDHQVNELNDDIERIREEQRIRFITRESEEERLRSLATRRWTEGAISRQRSEQYCLINHITLLLMSELEQVNAHPDATFQDCIDKNINTHNSFVQDLLEEEEQLRSGIPEIHEIASTDRRNVRRDMIAALKVAINRISSIDHVHKVPSQL
jgi:hypothetical protein